MNDYSIEIFSDENDLEKSSFDASIKSPLYVIILVAAMFLPILIKNKKPVKFRGGQNVRKQNE